MLQLKLNQLCRCDGSSRGNLGKSESISGVYGPVESQVYEDNVKGTIEVNFKGLSTPHEDVNFSLLLKGILESSIKFLPRTTISLTVRLLADEGEGKSCALLSAIGALLDGGISLLSIPIGVDIILLHDGKIILHATLSQRKSCKCSIFAVFVKDELGARVWISYGECTLKEQLALLQSALDHSKKLRKILEENIVSQLQNNKDLCL
jgi:ribonuclease PH